MSQSADDFSERSLRISELSRDQRNLEEEEGEDNNDDDNDDDDQEEEESPVEGNKGEDEMPVFFNSSRTDDEAHINKTKFNQSLFKRNTPA